MHPHKKWLSSGLLDKKQYATRGVIFRFQGKHCFFLRDGRGGGGGKIIFGDKQRPEKKWDPRRRRIRPIESIAVPALLAYRVGNQPSCRPSPVDFRETRLVLGGTSKKPGILETAWPTFWQGKTSNFQSHGAIHVPNLQLPIQSPQKCNGNP